MYKTVRHIPPQKGADAKMVQMLDDRARMFAEVAEQLKAAEE